MPPDMEVNALIIVDRNDAHPKIFIRIRDRERGEYGSHSNVGFFTRIVAAAQRCVLEAKIGIVHLDARPCVESHFGRSGKVEIFEFPGSAQAIGVQDVQVRGVDQRLEHLHVITAVYRIDVDAVAGGDVEPRVARKRRLQIRWTEIRPDQSASLSDGISLGTDARFECWIGDIRRFHDGAVDSELPAMKKAPDALALASTDDERGLSVTTPLVKYTHYSLAVSKSDKAIAHDFQREGIAIGLR